MPRGACPTREVLEAALRNSPGEASLALMFADIPIVAWLSVATLSLPAGGQWASGDRRFNPA